MREKGAGVKVLSLSFAEQSLASLMSFVEEVRFETGISRNQSKASRCVCCEAAASLRLAAERKLASHSHNTSRKGNSTSAGDTLNFRGRKRRSTHYGGLQYDADWPEVLTEGKKSLLIIQSNAKQGIVSVKCLEAHTRQRERKS